MSMESQKQQSGQNNSSLQGDGITRRNLLVITGKSVACLTLAPLSHVLADSGDIDGDGKVDENDLRIMVSEWLSSATSAISNLDNSYTYIPGEGSAASAIVSVDFNDFSILAGDWQKECSACSAVASVDFNKRVQRRLASSARRRFGQIARRRIEST